MKNKLALKFDSIQILSKKAQKEINGGYSPCPSPGYPNGSMNHPCAVNSPYYSGQANCEMYCRSGGYCC